MSLLLLLRNRHRLALRFPTGSGAGGSKHHGEHAIDPFEHIHAQLIQQQNKVIIQLVLSMAASGALL